jgi:hypothetical protein
VILGIYLEVLKKRKLYLEFLNTKKNRNLPENFNNTKRSVFTWKFKKDRNLPKI